MKLIDEKNYFSYIKDKTEIFETDLYDLDENLKIIQILKMIFQEFFGSQGTQETVSRNI